MAISDQNLSGNSSGRRFSLWDKPHSPEKITLDQIDTDDDRGSAVLGVKPEKKSPTKVGSKGPKTRPGKTGSGSSVTGKRDYGDRNPVSDSSETEASDKKSSPYDSNTPKLNLKRPQIVLDPFQESNYYSLIPVEQTLTLEEDLYPGGNVNSDGQFQVPITSSSVVGESGSGLTLMLAKKAYENYQGGRPTIILANRESNIHKIAQSVIDFAQESKREKLLDNVEVISGNSKLDKIDPRKKIYIISTDKLISYLRENNSYRAQAQLTHSSLLGALEYPEARLGDVLPLKKIREVLVDDAHAYTGEASEGYTKLLNTLLLETSTDPKRNPVHLFGTSATPYERADTARANASFNEDIDGKVQSMEFDQYFPELSRQNTPTAKELIEEAKFYKAPRLSLIEFDEDMAREMKHSDAKDRLHYSGPDSINENLVNLYLKEAKTQAKKKWHIIANSRENATELCALFNSKGVKARVATSTGKIGPKTVGHSGYFELLEKALEETDSRKDIYTLNDSDVESEKTSLRRKALDYSQIIGEYESGDCDVVIDMDTPSIHSTKTDKVVDLNIRYDSSNTHIKRLLGEAVRDRSSASSQNIEYLFLNPDNLSVFNSLITGAALELGVMSKHRSNVLSDSTVQSLKTETSVGIREFGGVEYNSRWFNSALSQILSSRYEALDSAKAIDALVEDFYRSRIDDGKSKNEIKSIVTGLTKDHKIFSQLIDFVEPDLREVFQKQLRTSNFDLKNELSVLVPDLLGVKDPDIAYRILNKSYESLVFDDPSYKPDEEWLLELDSALGMDSSQKGELRDLNRLRKFTEIIGKKFGLEFFENKFFLDRTLKVFTGAVTDFKLFGLLVNALSNTEASNSGKGFSFEDIRKDFPHLLGSQRVVPFANLQKKILSKYPDGPPLDQSLTRFFREQLYDDFAVDFSTLVSSVTNHSRSTDQELIDGSVQDEIYKFLEASYRGEVESNFQVENSLKPNDSQYELEIKEKAQAHLSTLTREILYNQVIAKIWGQGRSVRINNDDFVFQIEADELVLSDSRKSSLEADIDLAKINPELAIMLDHAVSGSSFDRVDIKKRLAFIAGSFLANKNDIQAFIDDSEKNKADHGDSFAVNKDGQRERMLFDAQKNPKKIYLARDLNPAEQKDLEVVLGATPSDALLDSQKDLLREFLDFHKVKIDKALPRFFDRLGVKNINEAKLVLKDQVSKIKNANQKWLDNFGSKEQFIDLLSEYVYKENPALFNRPENLALLLNSIMGNHKAGLDLPDLQSINRDFVDFANRNGYDLKTEELVLSFRDQIGIKKQNELFAVLAQPEFLDWENKKTKNSPFSYENKSNEGVLRLIDSVAAKLAMSRAEIFNLAGLSNPASFYAKPIGAYNQYYASKLEYSNEDTARFQKDLALITDQKRDNILARELLIKADPDSNYDLESVFTLGDEDSSPKIEIRIFRNQIKTIEQVKNPFYKEVNAKQAGNRKKKTSVKAGQNKKWLEADFLTLRYQEGENSDWALFNKPENIAVLNFKTSFLTMQLLTKEKSKLDKAWLSRMGLSENLNAESSEYQAFLKSAISFLSKSRLAEIKANPESLKAYLAVLVGHLGPQKLIGDDDKQTLFRDFVKFISKPEDADSNLAEILKESPKLTGVKSQNELKSVLDFRFETYEDFQREILRKHNNPTTQHYLGFMSGLTDTAPEKLLGFPLVQKEFSDYRNAMEELQIPEFVRTDFDEDQDAKSVLLSTILVRQLFPKANQNTYYLWSDKAGTPKGKDVLMHFVFTNKKLQVDIMHERGNVPYEFVSHEALNKNDKGEWTKSILNQNELKTRFVLMQLFGKDEYGRSNLNDLSRELNDAYDACLCNDQEYDYMFSKVTNLMAEFIAQDDPAFFNQQDGDSFSRALIKKVASLYGHTEYADKEFLNKFIDFAEAKHPGFEAIRQNPKFKEIFFDAKEKTSRKEDTKLLLDAITTKITSQEALDIFNAGSHKQRALIEIIELAKKRIPELAYDISISDVQESLGLPKDFRAHLKQAFVLLPMSLNNDSLASGNKAKFDMFKNTLNRIPEQCPDFVIDKYKATATIHKLFPELELNMAGTGSISNLDQLNMTDHETGEAFELVKGMKLEFDGEHVILWTLNVDESSTQREVRGSQVEESKDGAMSILGSVGLDEATGLWSILHNSRPGPVVETKQQLNTIVKELFDLSDIHAFEQRIRKNGSEDSRVLLVDYIQKQLSLSDEQMKTLFFGNYGAYERFIPGVEAAYKRLGFSQEYSAVIKDELSRQGDFALKNEDQYKLAIFADMMASSFPKFVASLQGGSANFNVPGLGVIGLFENTLQILTEGTNIQTASMKVNQSSKKWEADLFYEKVSEMLQAITNNNTVKLNSKWLNFFDKTIGTELLNPSSAIEASRTMRRAKYFASFLEDKFPNRVDHPRTLASALISLVGDKTHPQFDKAIFSEFVDYMSEPFPEMKVAFSKFPTLTGDVEEIQTPKVETSDLNLDSSIRLLREKYPSGIDDPEKLPGIVSALGLDMNLLKTSIDVRARFSNLSDIMTRTIIDYADEFNINFENESSVRQLPEAAFGGDNLKRVENKLLAEKIWSSNPFSVNVSFAKSALEINFNGDVELFKLYQAQDGSSQKELVFSMTQDATTGLYIPKDPQGKTILLKADDTKQLQNKLRNLVKSENIAGENKRKSVNPPMPGISQPERLEATFAYIKALTGKTEEELFEDGPDSSLIQTKYHSGFRKLLSHIFPRNSTLVSGHLGTIDGSLKEDKNLRLLKLDHLVQRVWGELVDPYKDFTLGNSFQTDLSTRTKLRFVMKPGEVRINSFDEDTNRPLKLYRVGQYNERKDQWSQVTEHDDFGIVS